MEFGAGEDGCGGMKGDSGIVTEDVCEDGIQNLGGRLVLMLIRAGILVGEMVVVAGGVISFSEKRCLSVTEVECLRVGFGLVEGDILDLSGGFIALLVEMEVDDLELEVGTVVRLIWGYLNWRLYFLWRLSRMSLESKMSKIGGRPFGMVMRVDFLMEFFFFDDSCLGKVAGSKMEVVVIEILVVVEMALIWRARSLAVSGFLGEIICICYALALIL